MIDVLTDMESPTVVYQGVPGAYSEEALAAALPHAVSSPRRTLADVFAALSSGEVRYAFVPVENSHAGSVVEVYDLMLDVPVTIRAEWMHPVHHYLLGVPGTEIADIEKVYSHPQALAQSTIFLRGAGLEVEPFYDTAGSAQMVSERGDPRFAAVAGRLAGERYGLAVLAECIETDSNNATRFFLLESGAWSQERSALSTGLGKTSVAFAVEHRPGALMRALGCFAQPQVNLAKLESRPSRRERWEYLFFADLEGHEHDPKLRLALRELKRLNPFVQVLGSYQAAQREDK